MNIFFPLKFLIVALITVTSINSFAAGGHDEHAKIEESTEQQKGPNGGKLLSEGGFSLEIIIYESGIPPEMRIYAYDHGKIVSADQLQLKVTLNRLGGEQDHINFKAELDYLLGDKIIREPHSYDVTVTAEYSGQQYQWRYESHEGRTTISDRQLKLAGIKTDQVKKKTLQLTQELFGVVEPVADQVYRVNAAYPGIVEQVFVNVGEQVNKGQPLVALTNTNTLQRYTLNSPSSGEITQRWVNPGDKALDKTLLEISDYKNVWVEMSAFPESIEQLAVGQPVIVRDLHHHKAAQGEVIYLSPQMTDGHIARARTLIGNNDGHWRPGMHVKATVITKNHEVPLAIKTSALQLFRGNPVVFAKYGNQFEVRMVELGEKSGDYQEVKGGITAGTEYVTENSFLIKADVLKSGASHDH